MTDKKVSDPLQRKLPDEPHFALLARDPIGYRMARLWIAYMKRDFRAVEAIDKQIRDVLAKIPRQPHKEAEKVMSATIVANEMHAFYENLNAPGRPAETSATQTAKERREGERRKGYGVWSGGMQDLRINFDRRLCHMAKQAELNEIMRATPPAEPDEAQ